MKEFDITGLKLIIMILLITTPRCIKEVYLNSENNKKYKILLSIFIFLCAMNFTTKPMIKDEICIIVFTILSPLLPWIFKLLNYPKKEMYNIIYYIYIFILLFTFSFGIML